MSQCVNFRQKASYISVSTRLPFNQRRNTCEQLYYTDMLLSYCDPDLDQMT